SKVNSETNNAVNVSDLIANNKKKKNLNNYIEKSIPSILFLIASITVLTTIGILYTLVSQAIQFFMEVPILDFFTGTELKPLSQNPQFGILPLLNGTIISSLIAILVAGPIGLMSAIYLSEYATDRVRKVLKPLLEILAGIP